MIYLIYLIYLQMICPTGGGFENIAILIAAIGTWYRRLGTWHSQQM